MWAGYRVGRVLDGLTGLPDMVVSVRFVKSPHGIHLTADPLFSSWYASTGPENNAGGCSPTLDEEVLRLDWVGSGGVVLACVNQWFPFRWGLSYDGRSSEWGEHNLPGVISLKV